MRAQVPTYGVIKLRPFYRVREKRRRLWSAGPTPVRFWEHGGVRLVFLHGAAAAGKLTTARELSARLGYPVFHNHLVVDLLTGLFPFGSTAFVRLREEFWLRVFEAAAETARSLIYLAVIVALSKPSARLTRVP